MSVFLKKHPIYDEYSSVETGVVKNVKTGEIIKPFQIKEIVPGECHKKECVQYKYQYLFIDIDYYSRINVRYPLHVFIWECFYGLVPIGSMVEHIDGHRIFNVLDNLHLVPYKPTNFHCDCLSMV